MARVFLSYARHDAPKAQQLANVLGEAGHEVWWDFHLHGGSRFSSEIERALKDAEVVVVLWTPASVASAWVQDEAAEGRDTARLVPVTLDSTKPPLGFRQFQCVDLEAWDRQGRTELLQDLISAVSEVAGEEQGRAQVKARAEIAPPSPSISVCVLPFVNISDDVEQEYFSDGITEDVITDLSKISSLAVVARNTAFTFKGRATDVQEVARTLGVSHVVEGSVRKAGGRVRITAQLIAGGTGHHLWAERYDRDLTDIFAIQDELSHAIVEALQLKLLPEEKKAIEDRSTSNAEAYRFFLMARQQWVGGTLGDPRRDQAIVRICQQAVSLDPGYAQAWALMALAQAELRYWQGSGEDPLPAAERALSLDPDVPEALCVKARHLEELGRQSEANALIETALRLCPDSWEVNREAARMLFRQERNVEAIPFFEKAVALMSSDFHNPITVMGCYSAIGDREGAKRSAKIALERAERALAHDPTNGPAISNGAAALAELGEDERAKDWIERGLLLDPDSQYIRYNAACTLSLRMKDDDAAMDVLEPFFERMGTALQMKHVEADQDFVRLRNKPRFQAMIAATKQRLGLAGVEPNEPATP